MPAFNLNGLQFEVFNEIAYKGEQNYIKVSGTPFTSFLIDLTEYITDKDGKAIIDYTDVIKTIPEGEFTINVGGYYADVAWIAQDGIAPIYPIFPPRKLQLCDFSDFYIYFFLPDAEYTFQAFYNGIWNNIPDNHGEVIILQNWQKIRVVSSSELSEKPYGEEYTLPYTGELSIYTYFQSEIERYSCNCSNMKQLTWVGENGKKKSFTFLTEEEKRSTTEAIEFESFNRNGFDVRKNFEIGLKLKTENLNTVERDYLADLVTSSFVYLSDNYYNVEDYDQNERVTVSNANFTNKKNSEFEALEFDIKFKQHDTI